LHEPLVVVHRRLAAVVPLAGEGAAIHRQKHHAPAANAKRSVRIACPQFKGLGGLRHLFEHELGIESDDVALHLLTSFPESSDGVGMAELDTELAHDPLPAAFENR